MSAISSSERELIAGLCRERVPLGVQARSLGIDRFEVKALARELVQAGDISELPADDIRGGKPFTWPEAMLADAPAAHGHPVAATTGPIARSSHRVNCPCCGQAASALSLNLIVRACELPPQQEAILTRVWQGKGKPVTAEAIISAMYADDMDGGPEFETARKYFKTQLSLLRGRLRDTGVSIEAAGYQRGWRLVLEQVNGAANAAQIASEELESVPLPLVIKTEAPKPTIELVPAEAETPPTEALAGLANVLADRPRKKSPRGRARANKSAKAADEKPATTARRFPPPIEEPVDAKLSRKPARQPEKHVSLRAKLTRHERRTSRLEAWK